MNRRLFLKAAAAGIFSTGLGTAALAQLFSFPPEEAVAAPDAHVKDYLFKINHFDDHHHTDILLEPRFKALLESSLKRLRRLQQTVGHGNFYLLNFDEALNIARSYPKVGRFTDAELDFLEMIFYADGSHYGFLGEKPLKNLTDRVTRGDVLKIPYTGNFLYRGKPLEAYHRIKKDIGDQVILTSGVRSVIKQFMLFLDKAHQYGGNLSLASRSLAPPGYSYHGVGDFDVGQIGLGVENFTESFIQTRVFEKLNRMGYINLRYRKDNFLGVRYEPWHIKVHTAP